MEEDFTELLKEYSDDYGVDVKTINRLSELILESGYANSEEEYEHLLLNAIETGSYNAENAEEKAKTPEETIEFVLQREYFLD